MTYLQDENSVEDSSPLEGYEINLPVVTYRYTSADHDIIIDGKRFLKSSISRTEIIRSNLSASQEITITLPLLNPVVQRYLANGIPPRYVGVTLYRLQPKSGEFEIIWTGRITSLNADTKNFLGHFRIPSRSSEIFQRRLPTVTGSKTCPHTLFDSMCRITRGSYTVTASVVSFSGRTIEVSTIDSHPDNWFKYGEFIHIPSGEKMTIISQIGTSIKIHLPIYGLNDNDPIQIVAGCDHTPDSVNGCYAKFNNMENYGGTPQMPTGNPFPPQGYGIYTSE